MQISKKALAKISSVEEFWNLNRSMVNGQVVHRYLQMQETFSMKCIGSTTAGHCRQMLKISSLG